MKEIKFSQNLKNLRAGDNKFARKFTQQEIAHATKIARSLISDYEHGNKEPTLWALNKLADFFEISLDELCY